MILFSPEVYPELFTVSESHVNNCDVAFRITVVNAIPLYQFVFVAVTFMGILYESTSLSLFHLVFPCSAVWVFTYLNT